MTTLLFAHESLALHDTGHGHPERPDRIRAVMDALAAEEIEIPFPQRDLHLRSANLDTLKDFLDHKKETSDPQE